MSDENKSKEQLIRELHSLRARVSELEAAEQAVERNTQMYSDLVADSADLIYMVDANGVMTYVNNAVKTLFGYEPEEVIGTNFAKWIPQENLSGAAAIHRSVLEGEAVKAETVVVGKDGKLHNVELSSAPAIVDGKVVGTRGIIRDVTEHRKKDEELKESEERFRAIFDNTADGIVLANAENKRLYLANRAFCQMVGYGPEQITNLTVDDIHPKEDLPRVKIELEGQVQKRCTFSRNIPVKRKDGTVFYADINSFPISLGGKLYLTGVFRDITDRRKTEEELRKFKATSDRAAYGVVMVDRQDIVTYVNETFAEMHGYKVNELVGAPYSVFHTEEQLDSVRSLESRLMREGSFVAEEIWHKRKDNTTFPTLMSGTVVRDQQGKVLLLGATAVDITRKRRAQELLRESRQRLAGIVEAVTDHMSIIDEDHNILWANDIATGIFGPDVVGRKCYVAYHRRAEACEPCVVEQTFSDGRVHEHETQVIDADGNAMDLWCTASVAARYPDGRPRTVIEISRDITERKKARQKIAESEEKFRNMAERSLDMIYTTDDRGYVTYVSPASERIFLYRPEEMVGRHFEEFLAESEKSRVLRHFAQSLRHEEAVRIEMEVIRKDGTSAFVELHGSSLVKDGNTIGSQGIIRDVTERRKMRQSLLESEAKYRVLVELMPAVSYSAKVDEVSTATYISPQIEKITGFTPADYAADHELWTKCLHPEDRQRVMNALAHSHQSGESFVCEYRLIARDGHEVWVRDEGIIVGDDEGKPSHLHGVMYDITEQRKVDEEVRKSEIKYRTLVENLPTMVFLKDVNSVYVSCNQRFADDNGLRMEDILGKSDVDLFPGELAEKYRTDDVQIMESGQTRDIEEHYFRKGQDLVVHTIKTPVKDENGKVVGILGIFWDITEQKKAEEALKIRDSAIASSINGIAIADWQGMLTYVNASFLRMWGYDDEKEVLGRQAVELWHVPPDAVNMLEALRSRGSWMGGLKACRRDGSVFDAQVSAGTVVGESGRPICMMASFIDVTEARQKEEELSVFREKMVRAEQLASLGTLSATIAHELTQPLTVIRLSFENSLTDLKKTSCPERVIEDLRDGLDEVSNATSIVNRFRNYARKSELSLATDVDLKSVAERIVRLLGESARRAGVSVRIKDLDGLPRITANQKDMEQLFFALIENAIQAADGRESRWLILRGEVKDERVELQFSDTCGGIAPENLDKVFEPFFTTKPAGDGTGLGLCVARRIVARAGGRVRLESEPGVGSTFFVTLPIDERRTSRSGNSRK